MNDEETADYAGNNTPSAVPNVVLLDSQKAGEDLMTKEKKTCHICSSTKSADDHHYDCCKGKLSPETVPLCRRCHRTYHDLGVEWFEDEYLDKVIEIENKRREIWNQQPKCVNPLPLFTRADIKRSDYWNKKHGLPVTGKTRDIRTPAFAFNLPHGEPLCGHQWVSDHMYDLMDWVPRIEIVHPGGHFTADIDSKKKLKDVARAIRGLKKNG